MNCPSCSSDIPDYAGFCAFCGEQILRCPACAHVYPCHVSFCGHCGTRLVDDDDDDAARGAQIPRSPREAAVFQTSPGRPGAELIEGRPTFQLPSPRDERNPGIYGFIYDPEQPDTRHCLRRGDNTLGAGDNNDIIIDRPAVSWNHALLICRNAKVMLQDSASTNGTFVNGERIDRARPLENGDTVRVGNVTFQVWLKAQYR